MIIARLEFENWMMAHRKFVKSSKIQERQQNKRTKHGMNFGRIKALRLWGCVGSDCLYILGIINFMRNMAHETKEPVLKISLCVETGTPSILLKIGHWVLRQYLCWFNTDNYRECHKCCGKSQAEETRSYSAEWYVAPKKKNIRVVFRKKLYKLVLIGSKWL